MRRREELKQRKGMSSWIGLAIESSWRTTSKNWPWPILVRLHIQHDVRNCCTTFVNFRNISQSTLHCSGVSSRFVSTPIQSKQEVGFQMAPTTHVLIIRRTMTIGDDEFRHKLAAILLTFAQRLGRFSGCGFLRVFLNRPLSTVQNLNITTNDELSNVFSCLTNKEQRQVTH